MGDPVKQQEPQKSVSGFQFANPNARPAGRSSRRFQSLRVEDPKNSASQGQASDPSLQAPRTSLQLPNFENLSLAELQKARDEIAQRKSEIISNLSTALDEKYDALAGRLKIAEDLRRGAKSNYDRDVEELERQTSITKGGFFLYVGSTITGNYKTQEKQVEMSSRMWGRHNDRVWKLKAAVENAAEKKKAAIEALTSSLDAESRRLDLLVRKRTAEQRGDTQAATQIEQEFKAFMRDNSVETLTRSAERKLAEAVIALDSADNPNFFAEQQAMLRKMSQESGAQLQHIDNVEGYIKCAEKVVIVTAAGAVAFATAGAGTPVLLAALYGAGTAGATGVGLTVGFRTLEAGGKTLAGQEVGQEYLSKSMYEVRDNGIECAITGLGMGWAGRVTKARQLLQAGATTAKAAGTASTAASAVEQTSVQTFAQLARNTAFASRTAFLSSAPSSIYGAHMQTMGPHATLSWSRPHEVIASILGNMTIAGACGSTSHAGSSLRDSVKTVGTRRLLSRAFLARLVPFSGRSSVAWRQLFSAGKAPVLKSVYFAAETASELFITDWSSRQIAAHTVQGYSDESFAEQRKMNFLSGVMGSMTGNMIAQTQQHYQSKAQNYVDTTNAGVQQQVKIQAEASPVQTPKLRSDVTSSASPEYASQRVASRQHLQIESSSNPRLAQSEISEAAALTDRRTRQAADIEGHTQRNISDANDRTELALNAQARDRDGTPGMGFRSNERKAVQDQLIGSRQSYDAHQKIINDVLADVPEPVRKRILGQLENGKLSVEDKIKIIGEVLANDSRVAPGRRAALSDAEESMLNNRLRNDTFGEMDDAHARAEGIEFDPVGNPKGTKDSLEADLRRIIGEGDAAVQKEKLEVTLDDTTSRKNGMGYGEKIGSDVYDFGVGLFRLTRIPKLVKLLGGGDIAVYSADRKSQPTAQRLGKAIDVAGADLRDTTLHVLGAPMRALQAGKQKGWIIGTVSNGIDHTIRTLGAGAFFVANNSFAVVSSGPLVASGRLVFVDIPIGMWSASGQVVHQIRKAVGLTPSRPRDFAHALAVREQIDHRLHLVNRAKADGIEIDATLVAALRETRSNLTSVMKEANTRRGVRIDLGTWGIPFTKKEIHIGGRSRMCNVDSPEMVAIRKSIWEAAERGLHSGPHVKESALAQQGVRAIQSGDPDQLQPLLALARERMSADSQQRLLNIWQLELQTKLSADGQTAPAGGGRQAGAGAGGAGDNATAGNNPAVNADNGVNYALARRAQAGHGPENMPELLRRFATGEGNLRRDFSIDLDSVVRREQMHRAIDAVAGEPVEGRPTSWLHQADNTDISQPLAQVARLLETVSESTTAGRSNKQAQAALVEMNTRLQAKLDASRKATPADPDYVTAKLTPEKEAVIIDLMSRISTRRDANAKCKAIIDVDAPAENVIAALQAEFLSQRDTRSPGIFTAKHELDILGGLLAYSKSKARNKNASVEQRASWQAKVDGLSSLREASYQRFAAEPIRLPNLDRFDLLSQPARPYDLRDTVVQQRIYDPSAPEAEFTPAGYTLGEYYSGQVSQQQARAPIGLPFVRDAATPRPLFWWSQPTATQRIVNGGS